MKLYTIMKEQKYAVGFIEYYTTSEEIKFEIHYYTSWFDHIGQDKQLFAKGTFSIDGDLKAEVLGETFTKAKDILMYYKDKRGNRTRATCLMKLLWEVARQEFGSGLNFMPQTYRDFETVNNCRRREYLYSKTQIDIKGDKVK